MRFAVAHKAITFALATVAALPLLGSGELSLPVVVLAVALGVVGWFLEPPLTVDVRYRRSVTGIMLALLALQLGRWLLGGTLAALGMEFAVLLLGLKLASRGSATDYYQIAVLAFLHLIAGTIAIDDLSYAAGFVLFVALCPPALALTYLRREMERRFGPESKQDGQAMLERLLQSKRIVSPRFLVGASLLSVPVLVLTAVVFVLFPRIGLGLLGRLPTTRTTVGLSETVRLGDYDIDRLEDTVLMRLVPVGALRGRPEILSLHFRATAFDIYADDSWAKSTPSAFAPAQRQGDVHFIAGNALTPPRSVFEVLLESLDPPLVMVPEHTQTIETYPVQRQGLLRALSLETDQYGALRYEDKARVGLRYRVTLGAAPPPGPAPTGKTSYLVLPKDAPGLIALARELAPAREPRERIQQLVRGLRSRYRYSLRLADQPGNALASTPLDRFLFTRRTGTCEHFATAATLMLRAVGIPARTVTGFYGADWNPIGEFYAVRQRSAHSWTEAFVDGRWLTVHATPSATGAPESRGPSALTLLLDTLRMRWHRYVVGFDAMTQYTLALEVRQEWLDHVRGPGGARLRGKHLATGLAALGLMALLLSFAWRRFRGRRSGASPVPKLRRPSREAREATKLLLALDQRLERLGTARPKSISPEERAAALATEGDVLAAPVLRLTARLSEVRFGQRQFVPGEAEALRQAVRELARPPKSAQTPSEDPRVLHG